MAAPDADEPELRYFYGIETKVVPSAFGSLTVLKRGISLPMTHEFLLSQNLTGKRPGHVVVTPKSAEWLAEREEFVKRYEEMQSEGVARGFLEYDYEGYVRTTHTEDTEWVYDDENDNEEDEK